MPDEQIENRDGAPPIVPAGKVIERVTPTLFIGIGGTGMEILLRLRRHILNASWGPPSDGIRINSLTEFPLAEFINFDLAVGDVLERGRAHKSDLQAALVKFSDDERIANKLDQAKYCRDEDTLSRYQHIKYWFSAPPKLVSDLKIDTLDGAGQYRFISRLYFYDQYRNVRNKIDEKLGRLKASLQNNPQLDRLGLEQIEDKLKIVVICSIVGGTGSGSFLDMGWLSKFKTMGRSASVQLMALLPSAFPQAGDASPAANGYAALMELETAMRGGMAEQYIKFWDEDESAVLEAKPYDQVYLFDSGNLAEQHTEATSDVYQMVADALFEDFASADFANEKRSVAVNKGRHKALPFAPKPTERFPEMKLSFSRGYSAFGQAILDTQQSSQRDVRASEWAGEMLKAFFGVGSGDLKANRATDKQRDSFMSERMKLSRLTFSDFPEFSSRKVDLKRSSGEFSDFLVVEELLGNLVANVQQKVDDRIEAIKASFNRDEWVPQVRDLVKQLERDSIRDQDATADVVEDRIEQHSSVLIARIKADIEDQLYTYLDNHEFGGIEYVLTLVEQIKDQLSNASTGLISQLSLNAARYQEIRDAVRTQEYERLMGNLEQARGGFLGGSRNQSVVIMDQLKMEIANFLKFHLRTKAASEAVDLMTDLSTWLGNKNGLDDQGRPIWNGLVGKFQTGRAAVLDMLGSLQLSIESLKQDLKKDHATYIYIDPKVDERKISLPAAVRLREWAKESFDEIGGSKVLFRMLGRQEDRAFLLRTVRHMADRQLSVETAKGAELGEADPLFSTLLKMTPAEKQKIFKQLIARSMPWIDANLNQEFSPVPEQYACFIGVANAEKYQSEFGDIKDSAIPSQTQIKVSFVETGVPGRAVCYCELSGFPLTILRGLPKWRTSYKEVSKTKIPLHTHLNATQFVHPLALNPKELNQMADDFKEFILAQMLGILTRVSRETVPPGAYMFAVSKGENIPVGSERLFRRDGLPSGWREQIINRTRDRLEALGKTQMAALALLADHYKDHVYAPKLNLDKDGVGGYYKGFASILASEAAAELKEKAKFMGCREDDFEKLEDENDGAIARISKWAIPVARSDKDAYEWEVAEADEMSGPRLKYVVRKELFAEGADDQLAEVLGLKNLQPPPPAPPPQAPAAEYMLGMNGQQAGPYTKAHVQQYLAAGQITQETLLWKVGMSGWLPISQVPEFAAPPPLPSAAPPLPTGAPPLPGR